MAIIFYNQHCIKCNVSDGMKRMGSSDEDDNYLGITELTDVEDAKLALNKTLKLNNCDVCGGNNWDVYNIELNHNRLKKKKELFYSDFLANNNSDKDTAFYYHSTKFCRENDDNFLSTEIEDSFIEYFENIYSKLKRIFIVNPHRDAISLFRSIIEVDFKRTNFSDTNYGKYQDTVNSTITEFKSNAEVLLEFGLERDIYNKVVSLFMNVSEGFWQLVLFITINIEGSTTFVFYDKLNVENSYYIIIFDKLQIKFNYTLNDIYNITIKEDILDY